MPIPAMSFKHNIDLTKNQIINVVLHNEAAHPTAPKQGQVYYNTADQVIYYWDGTEWVIIGKYEAGEGLSSTANGGVVTFDINVDDVTLEIDNDTVIIKDQGVSTAKIKDGNVTTIKVADNAITFAKMQNLTAMTVIGALVSGDPTEIPILDEDDLGSDSDTSLATQQSIKAYIDTRISGFGTPQGSWDASAASTFPGNATNKPGDYWRVSAPGTVLGVTFNIGDVVEVFVENPNNTNPNHYTVLESNRDQATTTILGVLKLATNAMMDADIMTDNISAVTPALLQRIQATESKKGIAEIATQPETDAGTDDTRMITPLKLNAWYDAKNKCYAATIGNGSAVAFALSHGINSTDVDVTLYEIATGENIYTIIARTDANTVTVTFGADNVPTSNQYRVLIKKRVA